MNTKIALFARQRNPETGKRESITVYPETLDGFDTDRLIVAYYIRANDQYVTIPGTEYEDVAAEWLAQFEVA